MWLIHTLTPVFGTVALLALVAAGVVMMFSPSQGRLLLKNALIALGLFVVGTMLVQASCSFLFTRR